LKVEKKPSRALSKLLLKPADIPEFIEDLPDVLPPTKEKNVMQREHIKPRCLIKTSMKCSEVKEMTGIRTWHSPTSSSRASKYGRNFTV
jgi:hypothetical protein